MNRAPSPAPDSVWDDITGCGNALDISRTFQDMLAPPSQRANPELFLDLEVLEL